jgi:hypothetical protein
MGTVFVWFKTSNGRLVWIWFSAKITVFWDVTPCSSLDRYKHLMKMEAACFSLSTKVHILTSRNWSSLPRECQLFMFYFLSHYQTGLSCEHLIGCFSYDVDFFCCRTLFCVRHSYSIPYETLMWDGYDARIVNCINCTCNYFLMWQWLQHRE